MGSVLDALHDESCGTRPLPHRDAGGGTAHGEMGAQVADVVLDGEAVTPLSPRPSPRAFLCDRRVAKGTLLDIEGRPPPPHVRDVVEGGGDARAEDVQVSAALVVLSFLLHAHQQHEVVSERPRHGLRLACHEDSRPHEQCDDQRGEWAMGGGGSIASCKGHPLLVAAH